MTPKEEAIFYLKKEMPGAFQPTKLNKVIEKAIDIAIEKSYNKALDDNNILYGESAKRFLEQLENPPPLTLKQKKFVEECDELYNKKKLNLN